LPALRIHWCWPLDNGQQKATKQHNTNALDFTSIVDFAQEADELGIDSLLMSISYRMPDPLRMIGTLICETSRVKFIFACRPGLLRPTLFTEIVNTVSWMSEKRIALNLMVGVSPDEQACYGDFVAYDGRYERTSEFLEILHRFWKGETPLTHHGAHYCLEQAQLGLPYKDGERPHIYLSGSSELAQRIAIKHSDCWLHYGDTPQGIAEASRSVLDAGCSVGIRMHVLARETRAEALKVIESMVKSPDKQHQEWIGQFHGGSNSEAVKTALCLASGAEHGWPTTMLWSSTVAYRGCPALCMVGSYQEVAEYLLEYKKVGISEFIFSGWQTREEMRGFCRYVLPRLRKLETALENQHA